jgi:hypothetical protein
MYAVAVFALDAVGSHGLPIITLELVRPTTANQSLEPITGRSDV